MITIIILTAVYIISVFANRNWIIKAYSINGRWSDLKTDISDLLFTLLPLVNTILMAINLFDSPYKPSYKKRKNFDKFFGIKTLIILLFISLQVNAQKPKVKDFLIPALLKIPQGFFRGAAEAKWFYGDLNSFKNKYKDFDNGDYSPAFFGSKTIFVMFTDEAHRYNSIGNFSGELSQAMMPNMQGLKFWQKATVVGVMTVIKGSFRNLAQNYIFKPKKN